MPARHLAVVSLLVLLVTAGCAGVFGTDSDRPTATPAAVGDGPVPGVPAVEQNGSTVVVDAGKLVTRNNRARARRSHTLVRNVSVQTDNGTVRLSRTRRVADNRTLERLSVDGPESFTTAVRNGTLYSDDTGNWARTNLSNGRTVTSRLVGDEIAPYGFGAELPSRVLAATEFRVRQRADSVVLATEDIDLAEADLLPISAGVPGNERARVVVTEDGLVTAVVVEYDAVQDGEQLSVRIVHRLRDVDETTVRRPSWAAE